MHPGWELANLYVDEGLSGTSMKQRVQFQQMVEDCKAGQIDYIITKSVSRFRQKHGGHADNGEGAEKVRCGAVL